MESLRREDRQPWKFLAQVLMVATFTVLALLPIAGIYVLLRWVGIL